MSLIYGLFVTGAFTGAGDKRSGKRSRDSSITQVLSRVLSDPDAKHGSEPAAKRSRAVGSVKSAFTTNPHLQLELKSIGHRDETASTSRLAKPKSVKHGTQLSMSTPLFQPTSTASHPSSTKSYPCSTTSYPCSTTSHPSYITSYPSSTTSYPSSTTSYPSSTTSQLSTQRSFMSPVDFLALGTLASAYRFIGPAKLTWHQQPQIANSIAA